MSTSGHCAIGCETGQVQLLARYFVKRQAQYCQSRFQRDKLGSLSRQGASWSFTIKQYPQGKSSSGHCSKWCRRGQVPLLWGQRRIACDTRALSSVPENSPHRVFLPHTSLTPSKSAKGGIHFTLPHIVYRSKRALLRSTGSVVKRWKHLKSMENTSIVRVSSLQFVSN